VVEIAFSISPGVVQNDERRDFTGFIDLDGAIVRTAMPNVHVLYYAIGLGGPLKNPVLPRLMSRAARCSARVVEPSYSTSLHAMDRGR